MTAPGKLTKTFMDVVGDLRPAVNWDRRAQGGAGSFNSADGTFGDVVSATQDGAIGDLGFTTMLWAYGVLLGDTKTPTEIIARLLPPITETFVGLLKETPLAEQETSDLVRFMDSYNKSRYSGRFDAAGIVEISKVMQQMADNFSSKCEQKRSDELVTATVSSAMQGVPNDIRVNRPIRLK